MAPTYPKVMGVPPTPERTKELSIHHEILNVYKSYFLTKQLSIYFKVDLVYPVTLFRFFSRHKPKAYICIVFYLCNK